MSLISIIIPIYNSEEYLSACLQSIIDQTYTNWEVLLVNDGSTDGSTTIIDKYVKQDSRFLAFSQNNQGQAVARNLGLSKLSGEFVMFVDSDDKISADVLANFFKIQQSSPTLACYQFPVFYGYGTKNQNLVKYADQLYQNTEFDFMKLLLSEKEISWIVCNKIIRSSIAVKIKFEQGMIYEDNFYVLQLLEHINNIYTSSQGVYYYYERQNSTTTSLLTEKKERDSLKVIAYALTKLSFRKHRTVYLETLLKFINIKKSLLKNFKKSVSVSEDYFSGIKILDIAKSDCRIKDKVKLFLVKSKIYDLF